jgi:hypothetical protein
MQSYIEIIVDWVRVMVFNATFNNISVISWRSVLFVEVPEYSEKTTDLCGRDCMVVGFTTSYAINAYHH